MAVKAALMSIAVWSHDFIYLAKASTIKFEVTRLRPAPWIQIENLFYKVWLSLPLERPSLEDWLIRREAFPGTLPAHLLIFLLKLPILIFDILCGLVVYEVVREISDSNKAKAALTLWLVNPYTLLVAEMMGSNDVLPALFAALSVWLFLRGRRGLSFPSLAAGVAVKFYPLLMAPVLAILEHKAGSRRRLIPLILAAAAGLAAYEYWTREAGLGFQFSLLNYGPLTFQVSEMIFSQYTARVGLSTASATVYAYLMFNYWEGRGKEGVLAASLGFLLTYFAFLNWWPQYLLLLLPFLTADYALHKENRKYFYALLTLAFLCALIYFEFATEKSLFYVPNYAAWMDQASALLIEVKKSATVEMALGPILRSAYAVLSLIYAGRLLLEHAPTLRGALPILSRGSNHAQA